MRFNELYFTTHGLTLNRNLKELTCKSSLVLKAICITHHCPKIQPWNSLLDFRIWTNARWQDGLGDAKQGWASLVPGLEIIRKFQGPIYRE